MSPAHSALPSAVLRVEHFPNPTSVHTPPHPLRKPPPQPFVWYYRTEVENISNGSLRVVQFESYSLVQGRWLSSNVLGRPLDAEVFGRWYGHADKDDPIVGGLLLPGDCAVCGVNWHCSPRPFAPPVKWVFYAMDEQGTLHTAEAQILSVPYGEGERSRN